MVRRVAEGPIEGSFPGDRGRLRAKVELLPERPGVYLMKNARGEVIYVGKANSLKQRVRSYFTGAHDAKTERMIAEIADFETIVVPNPTAALLLEMNLIKRYAPRYNVLLKDDKSYPYIKVTHEEHPRIEITRRVQPDGGRYFGPYPHAQAARATKRLLDKLYPLRKCRTLPDRPCLYYHMGQCLAPCIRPVDSGTYEPMIREIAAFLRGKTEGVERRLEAQMWEAAERFDFERAAQLRDLLREIGHLKEEQAVLFPNRSEDWDIAAFSAEHGRIAVQIFHVRAGRLLEGERDIRPYYGEPEEAFVQFLGQYYLDFDAANRPSLLLLPPIEDAEALGQALGVRVHVPKRGGKRRLLEMAQENARHALEEHVALETRDAQRIASALEELGRALGIPAPRRVDVLDQSHLFGAQAVGVVVVFVDGRPSKHDYRTYRIREATRGDDYGALREVLRRRYGKLLEEGGPWPDLVVLDGGRGHLAVAREVLAEELGRPTPLLALAKDERHETRVALAGDPPRPLALSRRGAAFLLLVRMQEEVHRFAVATHRRRRKKEAFASILDEVPGIGPKRKRELLRRFGSLERIRTASEEELAVVVGKKLAQTLRAFLAPAGHGEGVLTAYGVAEPSVEYRTGEGTGHVEVDGPPTEGADLGSPS